VNTALKRTPLYATHVKAGARMVEFGGWDMPVQYSGIIEEHRRVRGAVGLFDVSHMGEFEVEGPNALTALQALTTNDVAALEVGQIQYSLLCYPEGGIVDDLTVYRLAQDRYMITVNASNIDKDWAWVTGHGAGAQWRNISGDTGLIAVQGPRAEELVAGLADVDVRAIGYYRFARGTVARVPTLAWAETERLWSALIEAGAKLDVAPIGLGARDTLRLEMRYALYGNDIDETTNPLEAVLGWVVKPAKGDFIGKAAIERVRADGARRKLVGLEMADRAVARHGYPVLQGGRRVGEVTSGTFGPSVEKSIAMAYVETPLSAIGTDVNVEIRGQARPARVVKTPFHPPNVKR
jgi:aminomethyltransferase